MGFDFTVYKGSKGGKIIEATNHYEDLAAHEVLLKITHSGVCGTDQHYTGQDMVLGHEGIGIVQEIGKEVTDFKVGDRAGFGYQYDSCGRCAQCLSGHETYCNERHVYGVSEFDRGSFATHTIRKDSFLFHIPDGMDSADAAPLMCAGATVFNALHTYGVEPGHRVGVVGVGGLGHLCIMYAAKMGCEVVVFSGHDTKKVEAVQWGAREFVSTSGLKKLDIKPVDHLLITTSAPVDWNLYLPAVSPGGTIFPLTVSGANLSVPSLPLILAGHRIQGVFVSPRHVHNQMLQFSALHGIKPVVQTFPMSVDGIEEVLKRMGEGKIRYRGVLVA